MTRVLHLRSGQGLYGAERSLLALAAATEAPFEPVVVSLVRPGREDTLGLAATEANLHDPVVREMYLHEVIRRREHAIAA